jgi:hypothetical protein
VIATPNSLVFDPSKLKRGAAMGTVQLQKSQLATTVPEQDKLFAKKPHLDRRAFEPTSSLKPTGHQ